jgi:hypothetical protein
MLVRFLSIRRQQKQSRPISKIESKIKITVCFPACHLNKYSDPLIFSKFFTLNFTIPKWWNQPETRTGTGIAGFTYYDVQKVLGCRL